MQIIQIKRFSFKLKFSCLLKYLVTEFKYNAKIKNIYINSLIIIIILELLLKFWHFLIGRVRKTIERLFSCRR